MLPEILLDMHLTLLALKWILSSTWLIVLHRIIETKKSWSVIKSELVFPEYEKAKGKVAVIIPARNASKTIVSVINSLLRQTYLPSIVAVVDDASNDDTSMKVIKLLKSLGASIKSAKVDENKDLFVYNLKLNRKRVVFVILRLKRHSGKYLGTNYALNEISKIGNVDYVLVLDSDTILESKYLEKLIGIMRKNKKIAAISGVALLWKAESKSKVAKAIASAYRNLLSPILFLGVRMTEYKCKAIGGSSGCAILYRMSKLRKIGNLSTDALDGDLATVLNLQIEGYKVGITPYATCYTVDIGHPLNFIKRVWRIACGNVNAILTRLGKIYKKRRWNLLLTCIYTSIGGVVFALTIIDILVTIILMKFGYFLKGPFIFFLEKLNLQFLSFILSILQKYPISLFIALYTTYLLEIFAALTILLKIYSKAEVSKVIKENLKYIYVTPILLWICTILSAIALPVTIFRIATKTTKNKW